MVRAWVEVVVARVLRLRDELVLRDRAVVERADVRRVPVLRPVVLGFSAPELLLVVAMSFFSAPVGSNDITAGFRLAFIHRTHVCTPARVRRYSPCFATRG
jgi:hypothetical protein